MSAWTVVEFSAERGFGRVREAGSGREASFAIEAWWPCEPAAARRMDDHEALRPMLLPRVGERVEVTWKMRAGREVVARVARLERIEARPAVAFRAWLAAMGEHVEDLAGWSNAEWDRIRGDLPHDIADALETIDDPARHLAFLAWLRDELPSCKRLAWIRADGPVALEGAVDHPVVRVALGDECLGALVRAKLVFVCPTPTTT